jgi:hypothetical protein
MFSFSDKLDKLTFYLRSWMRCFATQFRAALLYGYQASGPIALVEARSRQSQQQAAGSSSFTSTHGIMV